MSFLLLFSRAVCQRAWPLALLAVGCLGREEQKHLARDNNKVLTVMTMHKMMFG